MITKENDICYCSICGKELNIDALFCQYCGNKINKTNQTYTKIEATVNNKTEVTVKKRNFIDSITEYLNKRQERKLEAKKIEAEEVAKSTKVAFICCFIFLGVGLLIGLIGAIVSGIAEKKEQERINEYLANGYIQIQFSDEDLELENYLSVKSQLEAAGFTNIELVDLNDHGFLGVLEDDVKTVSIAGDNDFSSGDLFKPNDKVIITFY